MAEKTARKPPPRRQTGPKRRDTRQPRSWRRTAVVGAAAAAGLALGILVIALLASRGGGGGASPQQALTAAGCTFQTYPDQGQSHVDSYDAKISYNSFPPTSGPHHVQPVIWGAYQDVVPTLAEVHNLEHGGVIVHYGDQVDPATRAQLRSFYEDSPNAMLLAPLPRLGSKIALTAWTRLATCERFDESGFSAFRSAYRGNGPERFRIGDLAPGT